ncbi:12600_t:CDS:2, partial [Ambispora gerdemannii]
MTPPPPSSKQLPTEIYEQIFQSFIPKNGIFSTRDLHSIILVNHQWCNAGIPLLWSQPFNARHSIKKQTKIIDVYLSFMPKRERRDIFPFTKNISMMFKQLWSNKSASAFNKSVPAFDYPHFAKELDVDGLFEIVLCWCYLKCRADRAWDVVVAIMNLFYQRNATFERVSGPFNFSMSKPFLKIFYVAPGLQEWISSIQDCRLICEERIEDCSQPSLADLSKLDLTNTNTYCDDKNTATIHKTLFRTKGLCRFKLKGCVGHIDTIIDGLKSNADTLQEIEFTRINFRWTSTLHSLAQLTNLRLVTFVECRCLSKRLLKPLFSDPMSTQPYCCFVDCDDFIR